MNVDALPGIVVYAPEGPRGYRLVTAAKRAHGLGVLDFQHTSEAEHVDAFSNLDRLNCQSFGVRGLVDQVLKSSWSTRPVAGLDLVVLLVQDNHSQLESAIQTIRLRSRLVLAEVTSREDAAAALGAGADGIIIAGHEAGGLASEESSYILLQSLLNCTQAPIWVRGGVGPRGAAGCVLAGARGVVLDGAVLLAAESPVRDRLRERAEHWDGTETIWVPAAKSGFRFIAPARASVQPRSEVSSSRSSLPMSEQVTRPGWLDREALPLGQDAAFSARLAREHVTTGGMVRAYANAIEEGLAAARRLNPLAENAPLARALGTRYPILQGPMTRVSDVPAFALEVARGGGLPFLALAMMTAEQVQPLLEETSRLLEDRPWGVGILGFVSPELRREQIEAVERVRPPFAIIAGGRPDQGIALDRKGVATFLHAPSPSLLESYLREGARRFVLEGRECGGHVGPRSSLVLWEQAIITIEDALDRGLDPAEIWLVFAGGIHDRHSAAVVSGMAAPIAARGVKIGVLMGTPYLFTREAVASGAIVPEYQAEVLRCRRTVLLESGTGHQVRVAPTPFVERFATVKARLLSEGRTPDEIREELERLNLGRLRIASKGLARVEGAGSELAAVDSATQAVEGLYMLGQTAGLRTDATTIAELHAEVASGYDAAPESASRSRPNRLTPSDIAIVGMSAIFPGAIDLPRFWSNTLKGIDSVTEVPLDHWDWRLYYDPDPTAPDKIISKWGGFVPDVPFDPLRYGMPPASLPSIEPAQLLALETARAAIADAGYAERGFARDRAAVVLGMGGGAAQLAMGYAVRSYLPMLTASSRVGGAQTAADCLPLLPEWTEDSFPGFLLNVTAGRIANRLNLGGANYTVDAACGSSLAALALGVRELESEAADLVLVGGVDTVQNPFTYLAFSKTQAFSPGGRCRPFDAGANGIVISEGAAFVVLKRLADAERDGDRIYAVIKGVGASSDGKARGLTAPVVAGQSRALERAYAKAGLSPARIGYVEAHGTGTALGDQVELEALGNLLRSAGAQAGSSVVGSVKSMIGHTKCAAGLAGLLNATLALHHKVLPPTIGVTAPTPALDLKNGPLTLRGEATPWFHPDFERPRAAGVSAFGFGGANFHAVLQEYPANLTPQPQSTLLDWPAELFVLRAETAARLRSAADRLLAALNNGANPRLADLAHTLAIANRGSTESPARAVLAIVASDLDELKSGLTRAIAAIDAGKTTLDSPTGIHLASAPRFGHAKLAVLFPGQGAQRPGMLRELAVAFPAVRQAFAAVDQALATSGHERITAYIFPPARFDDEARAGDAAALAATERAQPALAAAGAAIVQLLTQLEIEPDFLAGHSFGELVALHAAEAITADALAVLAAERGRLMAQAAAQRPGAMAALSAAGDQIETLLHALPGVSIANWNAPRQTVVAGPADSIQRLIERARASELMATQLEVSGAFHTESVAAAAEPFARLAARRITQAPATPGYANLDAAPHPDSHETIAARLGDHLKNPVLFSRMIEEMHDAGARVFLDAGPGSILAPLVEATLGEKPHAVVSFDASRQPGLLTLLRGLAKLAAAGVEFNLESLTADRGVRTLDLENLPSGEWAEPVTASTWLVNGARTRPIHGPEPRRLGAVLGSEATSAAQPPSSIRNGTLGSSKPAAELPRHLAHSREIMAESHKHPQPGPRTAGVDRVMESFQETMRAFLETQKATMLAYLGTRGVPPGEARAAIAPGVGLDAQARSSPEPSPERNGQKVESHPSAPSTNGHAHKSTLRAATAETARELARNPLPADRETITRRLLEIVRDRTGYPLETLGLELDIEADLGIDSIKRVEILSKLRDEFPALKERTRSGAAMDTLARARTLASVVEHAAGHSAPAVMRSLIQAVPAPISAAPIGLAPGGRVIVTDDGQGIAEALKQRLEQEGIGVDELGSEQGGLDWTSPSAVEDAVRRIRARGPIAGVIHASPLASCAAVDFAWTERIDRDVKGLFLLAKAVRGDLEHASTQGGSVFLAAVAGSNRLEWSPQSIGAPGQGAVAGLVKTLAREWPGVRARVIDFHGVKEPSATAIDLVEELFASDGWVEVIRDGNRRLRLESQPAPLDRATSRLEFPAGGSIVVSGGARGVTALGLVELARAWKPRLLILGSSPHPQADEEAATRDLENESEIKAALHTQITRGGQAARPAEIESRYRSLRKAREIRANLKLLRGLCPVVEYASVDVCDTRALAPILEEFRIHHGGFRGVIHGAGLIQDKLIRDKSIDSFDRVLATKLSGALNLMRLIDSAELAFTVFYSSIAGRFGNVGQSDYAAANELLNKLALWLDKRVRGRVASIIWGPWSGVGMVSSIETHLERSGLGMITPEAGARLLLDELRFGRKGDVEVIHASSLGTLEAPMRRPAQAELAELIR